MRSWPVLVVLTILLGMFAPDRVTAQPIVPPAWDASDIDPRSGLNAAERRMVQDALTWMGVYSGALDGDWSKATDLAMRSWRSTAGLSFGPRLSRAELLTLLVQANRARAEAGWTTGKDPATGFWVGWPAKSTKPPMPVRDGTTYGSDYEPRGSAGLKLMTRVTTEDPRALVDALLRAGPGGPMGLVRVTSRVDRPDRQAAMLLTGSGASIYLRFERTGADWRGFTAMGLTATAPLWLVGPMNDAFTGSAEPPVPPPDPETAPILAEVAAMAGKPEWSHVTGAKIGSGAQAGLRATGSGTAFVVGRNGAMLTNAHVVNGCEQLKLSDGTQVTMVAADPKRDLALVKAAHGFGTALSFRREQTIDHGEQVRVFGFPYYRLVSESLNITDGIVTSLSGVRGSALQFQMSANLQPGNSGGPVLDEAGNVIGVSVAVLNSLAVARLTGSMPQGMNYAVRGSEAEAFLSEHGTEVAKRPSGRAVDLREMAKATTPLVFPLLCYN